MDECGNGGHRREEQKYTLSVVYDYSRHFCKLTFMPANSLFMPFIIHLLRTSGHLVVTGAQRQCGGGREIESDGVKYGKNYRWKCHSSVSPSIPETGWPPCMQLQKIIVFIYVPPCYMHWKYFMVSTLAVALIHLSLTLVVHSQETTASPPQIFAVLGVQCMCTPPSWLIVDCYHSIYLLYYVG